MTETVDPTPHPSSESLDLSLILRTVGDPVRLRIVRMLGNHDELTCGEVAEELGISKSNGSYHLRLLREAGVTRTRRHATERHISLRRDDLDRRFPGMVELLLRRDQ